MKHRDHGRWPRRLALLVLGCVLGVGAPARAERPKPAGSKLANVKVRTQLQGASRVFAAPWGLVAQGSGQLRILPSGTSRWTTVYQVKGDSLYRVAFDDAGRLLASWEHESDFHLFVPSKRQDVRFAKPAPPSPELKYGYSLEDLFFTQDGTGAIVYMHGFTGGRTWSTDAYHYRLDRPSEPTLLYRQPGSALHLTSRLAVFALPRNATDACEHNSCFPLGAVIGWEIAGAKATKRVLLAPDPNNQLSRVRLISGSDDDHVAVLISEHPRGRHVLRWRRGDAKAEFRPLPAGPAFDTEHMRLMKGGDLVEVWMTAERGLDIRRRALSGDTRVTALAPLPRRTPSDRPLFAVNDSMERTNGDLVLFWGEYVVVLPPDGPARRLDVRPLFKGIREFVGTVAYLPSPEGFWLGYYPERDFDLAYLPVYDLLARATTLPGSDAKRN